MVSNELSNLNGKNRYYIIESRQIDLVEWLIVNMYSCSDIRQERIQINNSQGNISNK